MSKNLIPNFTQIPNVIFDNFMHLLSGAEMKVLLYICRRTYGFQKGADSISITQLTKGIKDKEGNHIDMGTGLSNRKVIDCINKLTEIGLIHTNKVHNRTTKFTMNIGSGVSSLVNKVHLGSEVSSPQLVNKVHTQKKEKESIQKKDSKGVPLQVSEIIKLFEDEQLNIVAKNWYGNTTQRNAIEQLIENIGFDRLVKLVKILPKTNRLEYVSTITTPYQLLTKFSDLESQLAKIKTKQDKKINSVAF